MNKLLLLLLASGAMAQQPVKVASPVNGSGAVTVDGSGVTQPVSIAATINVSAAQSGTWSVRLLDGSGNSISSTSNALNVAVQNAISISGTVAATQSGTWTMQPGNTANTTPWLVTGTGGTFPVTGTFWQATQPVSAAALPLPSGASIAAKQPAIGTAGTASTDVITVQGIASMTPILVTPSALPANQSVNIAQVAGATTATGHGTASGALRVELPTDGTGTVGLIAGSAVIGHVIADTGSTTAVTGTVTVSGTVTSNAGTNLNTSLLALESGGNLATLAGAVTSSKVQDNIAQINGVAPSMGNGASGTGVQRVTIASDSTGQVTLASGTTTAVTQATASSLNAQVVGTAASGATPSGNPVGTGVLAQQAALPTAVSNGQVVRPLADRYGRLYTVSPVTSNATSNGTPITTNTNTQIIAAPSAGNHLRIHRLWAQNAGATGTWCYWGNGSGVKTIPGIAFQSSYVRCMYCISDSNTGASGDGFQSTASSSISVICIFCDSYNNSRDGFRLTASVNTIEIRNSIFVSNAGYGINSTTTVLPVITSMDYNFFYNNTTAARNQVGVGTHDVTLSGNPFTAAGSNDFSLNSTAGAGAAVRGAGFPGALQSGGTGYLDGGALQSQSTGSTTYIFPVFK